MAAQATKKGPDGVLPSDPPIFTLPQEVLLQALLLLQPHDVSSFGQACTTFHDLVTNSSSLWRGLYTKTWDNISGTGALPVLKGKALKQQTEVNGHPLSQSAKSKGKARRIDEHNERSDDTEQAKEKNVDYSLESLVQRRAKARSNLRKGASDPHRMLIAHTETLRELVSAARSRLAREQNREDPNADLPQSRTSTSLASMFPQNHVGDTRWAAYVYPRENLQRLVDWQPSRSHASQCTVQGVSDEDDEVDNEAPQKAKASDTKQKSHNGNKKQQRPVSSHNARKRAASPSSAAGSSRPRRSARLRKSNIPRELHSLLGDAVSDAQALGMPLELWPVHDHLSAELHVLHGVRVMKRDSPMDKLEKAEKRMKQVRAQKAANRVAGGKGRRTAPMTLSRERDRSQNDEAGSRGRSSGFAASGDDEEGYESTYENNDANRHTIDFGSTMSTQSASLHERLFNQDDDGNDDDGDDDDDDDDDDYVAESMLDEDASVQEAARFDPDQGDLDVIDGITSQDEADYLGNMDIDGISDETQPAFLFGHQLQRPYLLLGSEEGPSGDPKLLAKAKSIVYDTGRYAYDNCWGPLKSFRDSEDRPDRVDFSLFDDSEDEDSSDDDLHYDDPEVIELDDGSDSQSEGSHGDTHTDASESSHAPQGGASSDGAVPPASTNGGGNAAQSTHSTEPLGSIANLAPGVEIIDGNLVVPDGPSIPVRFIQEYAAQQARENHTHEHVSLNGDLGSSSESASQINEEVVQAPVDAAAEQAETESSTTSDSGDGLSAMLAEDEDEWSDGSLQADIWGVHEDSFSQRVAWVGAYAGSKARVQVSSVRGYLGSRQRKQSEQGGPWCRGREVDWTIVESIMIDVHSNLIRAIRTGGWGKGFALPPGGRIQDGGSIPELNDAHVCEHHRQARQLLPPCGWSHSRGDTYLPHANEASPPSTKKRDWANVESATWAGTYFFCDYPVFLDFNARLAGCPTKKGEMAHEAGVDLSLLAEDGEAWGDCLSLRLELLDAEEEDVAKAEEVERGDGPELMGEDDPEFPTLRFKGKSYTIKPDVEPHARGNCWGSVRPVFANAEESARRPYLSRVDSASGRKLPEIVALQWRIVHAYDGADRWSLTGIQAGPPGTRAPIYGIWSDVTEEGGSPNGPFVYMNVDSRPWKEVEDLLAESRAETRRRERQQEAQ